MSALTDECRAAYEVLTADNWHTEAAVIKRAADALDLIASRLVPFVNASEIMDSDTLQMGAPDKWPVFSAEGSWGQFQGINRGHLRSLVDFVTQLETKTEQPQ